MNKLSTDDMLNYLIKFGEFQNLSQNSAGFNCLKSSYLTSNEYGIIENIEEIYKQVKEFTSDLP